jgi:hypothetical protein
MKNSDQQILDELSKGKNKAFELYFKEHYINLVMIFEDNPDEKNFYVECNILRSTMGTEFSMTLIDDRFAVNGIIEAGVGNTVSAEWWRRKLYFMYLPNNVLDVYFVLHAVNEETYLYLQALINQIETDGGIYTPSPGPLPTNIEGGAIGFFGAAAVSDYTYHSTH